MINEITGREYKSIGEVCQYDKQVKFMEVTDHFPSLESVMLYDKLVNEEVKEYETALKKGSIVEMIDAIGDIVVTSLGLLHSLKFDDRMEDLVNDYLNLEYLLDNTFFITNKVVTYNKMTGSELETLHSLAKMNKHPLGCLSYFEKAVDCISSCMIMSYISRINLADILEPIYVSNYTKFSQDEQGNYIFRKDSNGKIIKPKGFKNPDFTKVLKTISHEVINEELLAYKQKLEIRTY